MKYLMTAFLILILAFASTYAEESNTASLFVNASDGKLVLESAAENASDSLGFDGAYPFEHGLSVVIRDGYYGVIDLRGNEIVPCEYESIAIYDNAIVVCLNDRYTLMSSFGEPVTDASYQMIFHNGYGFITIDKDQFGLVDQAGISFLDMEWLDIGAYCDGWMLLADSNYSCNYINPDKEFLLDSWADWGTNFSNGYAAFGTEEKIYITDTQGNMQQTNFTDIDLFPDNGIFLAKDANGNSGIYDVKEDNFTIFSAGRLGSISENMITIECGDKWGYCNLAGEVVIEPIYDEVRPFSEGFSSVRLGDNWIYIDELGNRINSVAYAQAYSFSEGYAACVDLTSKKLGFIDQSGQWIIEPRFQIEHEVFFKNGICNLGGYDPWEGCFIDKKGSILWEFQLDIDYFK